MTLIALISMKVKCHINLRDIFKHLIMYDKFRLALKELGYDANILLFFGIQF